MKNASLRIQIEQIGLEIERELKLPVHERRKAELREAMGHLKKAFQALEERDWTTGSFVEPAGYDDEPKKSVC